MTNLDATGHFMAMCFRDRKDIVGTPRDVKNVNYRTLRLLLATDDVPVSLTDIVLNPGIEDIYGYADRTEIAYCIEGRATSRDLKTNVAQDIYPGVLWVAPNSRFSFLAHEPTRLICVFYPPLEGNESGLEIDV